MILITDLNEKNWDSYPDEALKSEVGFEGVIEAMKRFEESVDGDNYVWYPFKAIYDYPPIKGKVPMPTGELEEKINDWATEVLNSD